MALKGNLDEFSMVQLLGTINLEQKTGTLTVDEDGKRIALLFREGKLIYASRDEAGGQLAAALREGGLIGEEQARTIESRAGTTSDEEVCSLLVNAGYVSQSDVIESVRSHILRNVCPLFAWSHGFFEFSPGLRADRGVITVPIDVEHVITRGTRWLHEWQRLQEALPDLDVALEFADRPPGDLHDFDLSPDEWQLISFVNPRNTIQQIAEHNGFSPFRVREIVDGLLQAGLVQIVQPEEAGAATEAGPEIRPPEVERNVIQRLIDRVRKPF